MPREEDRCVIKAQQFKHFCDPDYGYDQMLITLQSTLGHSEPERDRTITMEGITIGNSLAGNKFVNAEMMRWHNSL